MQVSYYKSKHKDSNLQKFSNLFIGLRPKLATFQARKCRCMGIKKRLFPSESISFVANPGLEPGFPP